MKFILLKFIPLYRFICFYFDKFVNFFIRSSHHNNKKSVVIVSNLGLGDAMDFICIADKYNILFSKEEYEITLICSPASYDVLKSETNFDYYIKYNLNNVFSNSINIFKRIKAILFFGKTKYNILIDQMWPFTVLPASLFLSNIIDADKKIICVNKAALQFSYNYIKKVYTDIYDVCDVKISNIEMYNYLPYYISDFDENFKKITYKKTNDVKLSFKLPSKYYIVFPSSTSFKKNWEEEKYVGLIKRIYKRTKMPVLFCGTNSDSDVVNNVIKSLNSNMYINILGKTNMLEFIDVIKRASYVITNDTGAYHVAVINEVPVTIITGGYTFDSFVKYNFKGNNYRKPYIVSKNLGCFNCHLKCIYKSSSKFPCLSDISVDEAYNVVSKMIDEN